MSSESKVSVLPLEDMKTLLSLSVSSEEIKKYQDIYESQLQSEVVDPDVKFHYAWCLVHSKHNPEIKKGAALFEDIFKEGSEEIKRESLFYLALAETKQKNYCTADKYIKAFLSVEPSNVQAQQIDVYIQERLKKDGMTGLAIIGGIGIIGGAAAIVVGTAAVGAALSFALKKGRK